MLLLEGADDVDGVLDEDDSDVVVLEPPFEEDVVVDFASVRLSVR